MVATGGPSSGSAISPTKRKPSTVSKASGVRRAGKTVLARIIVISAQVSLSAAISSDAERATRLWADQHSFRMSL